MSFPKSRLGRSFAAATAVSAGLAATAAPASAARFGTRNLVLGSHGPDVVWLQRDLDKLGYRTPVTGTFNRRTRWSVRLYQAHHGLRANGVVQHATFHDIYAGLHSMFSARIAVRQDRVARLHRVRRLHFRRMRVHRFRLRFRRAIVPGHGVNPIPGFHIGRDDMGIDASAAPGAPVYAPRSSTLVQVLHNWYAGESLYLYRFDHYPAGASSDYWYVAEQFNPAPGSHFRMGQRVGSYASGGTGLEIGWGSPTSNARTLADLTDPASAHPSGSSTIWGQSFKYFFGI